MSQYLGAVSQVLWWAITGCRDRKHLVLALLPVAQVLTPSRTHQASCWVCPRPPLPGGLRWPAWGIKWAGSCPEPWHRAVSARLYSTNQPRVQGPWENNLATSTFQITKQQICRKRCWCWESLSGSNLETCICLANMPLRYSKNPGQLGILYYVPAFPACLGIFFYYYLLVSDLSFISVYLYVCTCSYA